MIRTTKIRPANPRLWSHLLLTGAAVSLAATTYAEAQDHATEHVVAAVSAEGGEGGEGGEAGVVANETVPYLVALTLIEGHLRAGLGLYEEGRPDLAITHMKHPGDEIYTSLKPMLDHFNAPGFEAELAALADAVESGAPVDDVRAAFEDFLDAIKVVRAAAGASDRERLLSIAGAVRIAADEYGLGVQDGQIANLHEYQDALGFVTVARAGAVELAASDDDTVRAVAGQAIESLDRMSSNFHGLVPVGEVDGTADALYVAAAEIELSSYKVK